MAVKTQTVRMWSGTVKRSVSLGYLLHVPRVPEGPPPDGFPVLLFLHGSGERGTRPMCVAKHGPPKLARLDPAFPFVVVSPQCPAGKLWDVAALPGLLDEALRGLPVNVGRVSVTGLSMGGYATWELVLRHPERFCAAVPICGGVQWVEALLPDPRKLRAIRSVPIRAYHGAQDDVVPLGESERAVAALRGLGAEVSLTVVPDAGHDAWSAAYSDPDLFRWLLEQRRVVRGVGRKRTG